MYVVRTYVMAHDRFMWQTALNFAPPPKETSFCRAEIKFGVDIFLSEYRVMQEKTAAHPIWARERMERNNERGRGV